jgi:hypothetical protein
LRGGGVTGVLYADHRTMAGVLDVILFWTTELKVIQSHKSVNMLKQNKPDGFWSKRLKAVEI